MSGLASMRPVRAVGIGMHPYQFPTETPYLALGLTALRQALADAGLQWPDVTFAAIGTGAIGMAAGRVMLRHIGSTGLEVMQVENASASGSTAFRMACLMVASGQHEIALALGVDKFGSGQRAAHKDGIPRLTPAAEIPAVKFALMARAWRDKYGLTREDLARVAVKNHGNAARNPYAQFRKPRTLEQVLNSNPVAGDLTSLQCTPRGEGAAAVIVASEEAIRKHGLDRGRAIRVLSSVSSSEHAVADEGWSLVEMVQRSGLSALAAAGLGMEEIDIIELHDAFTIEEIVYAEALGLCPLGEGAAQLREGKWDIGGGGCAVNPSGGLLGMGHPIGPTGAGQIAEIVRQLRGEAEGRQHPGARTALAHMIGLGSVAVGHVLQRD
ncbi:thiolase family protein [Pseudoroseomonas ludipueritiae]|uniref:Thiolase family protein n=1 Tax=Pseudoroseomonas ludipueritiae TaxID=198093 RepID=A0ABR7R5J1_9PROT|nr:thiolase family protein [Pseudoroseomonas ludipueritiae]MBC9176993.1 thiolase family protein [Pseudoroseomonas ludipueritiae]